MHRYEKIMAHIDAGLSDGKIARKFGTSPGTIAVYRKAHDGTLTPINDKGGYRMGDTYLRDYEIFALHDNGMKPKQIAEYMNLEHHTVKSILHNKKHP